MDAVHVSDLSARERGWIAAVRELGEQLVETEAQLERAVETLRYYAARGDGRLARDTLAALGRAG